MASLNPHMAAAAPSNLPRTLPHTAGISEFMRAAFIDGIEADGKESAKAAEAARIAHATIKALRDENAALRAKLASK